MSTLIEDVERVIRDRLAGKTGRPVPNSFRINGPDDDFIVDDWTSKTQEMVVVEQRRDADRLRRLQHAIDVELRVPTVLKGSLRVYREIKGVKSYNTVFRDYIPHSETAEQ